jgi:hypothetical protein
MRLVFVVVLAAVGVGACEQRFSSNPPPLAPGSITPAPSGGGDPIFGPSSAEQPAVAKNPSHALTVTFCSTGLPTCPASEVDASPEARYRVLFGTGHAEIRSRRQAMTDIYQELRDRTSAGERLDAEARAPGDAGAPTAVGDRSKTSTSTSDALSQCAFHLLDLVDGVGEVTLDVVHAYGVHDCTVSLGGAGDGGSGQCLIQEPERPKRPGRGGGKGIAF